MEYNTKNETKTGTIKVQISQFIVKDGEVSGIIKKALVEAGFDLVLKPLFEKGTHYFAGEEITVYRMERVG